MEVNWFLPRRTEVEISATRFLLNWQGLQLFHRDSRCDFFSFQICDCGFNRVLGKHRAMELHGRQIEVFRDFVVLYCHRFFNVLSLHPFGNYAATSNCRTAAKRFEARVNNFAFAIDFNLEFHDIAARWGADKSSADVDVVLICRQMKKSGMYSAVVRKHLTKRTDIPRTLKVINNLSWHTMACKVRRESNSDDGHICWCVTSWPIRIFCFMRHVRSCGKL